MTIIEEWDAVQDSTLEPDQISFSVTTSVDTVDVDAVIDTVNETPISFGDGTGSAFSETDHRSIEEDETDWELQAACRAVDNATDLFFSEELPDIVAAKQICAECPVIAPCLEGALFRAEPCGVWGGQLFSNGRVLAQKRRRGRPPKVARPEDQLPVVPVPAHLQKLIA